MLHLKLLCNSFYITHQNNINQPTSQSTKSQQKDDATLGQGLWHVFVVELIYIQVKTGGSYQIYQ
jgi:hypothetical protein